MIKATTSEDTAAAIALAKAYQFDSDEIEVVRNALSNYFSGNSDDLWFTAVEDEPVGIVYCVPEPMTKGTWNILMLLVSPDHQGQGHGRALMSHVEKTLAARNARLVIVETSSLDDFERARGFYAKCGYREEARIRNFYASGDDKIVFSKALTA